MNRFVKQNLLLITVLSVSSLISLALLIYSGILYFEMTNCISETEGLRNRIRDLIRNTPAPVEGNKPRIQHNIDLYNKINLDVNKSIGRPYREAADRFIEILMGVKKGESIAEARNKFIEEFNSTVGKDENLARQGIALEEMREKYRNTWEKALEEFTKLITPLTQEPDIESQREALAFAAIGIPRKMQNNPALMTAYSQKYQEKISQLLGQKMHQEASSLGFHFLESQNTCRPEDIPTIARHWDIIGDICKRISTVDIKSFNFFRIRGIDYTEGKYENTFTTRGSYTVSHYSFEVTASLPEIRKLAHVFNFDPRDRRFYVIRSVFLYAPDTEAASARQILKPEIAAAGTTAGTGNDQVRENAPVRRGRRRGMVEETPQDTSKEEKEKEMRAKMLEEFEKREKKLPFYQRSGYGEIKLSGTKEYRAVFDIEYIDHSSLN